MLPYNYDVTLPLLHKEQIWLPNMNGKVIILWCCHTLHYGNVITLQ